MDDRIGFVGLGIMGKPMAHNLAKAGYSVTCYGHSQAVLDELSSKGLKAAGSEGEVASNSDIIITMVQDGPQVKKAICSENAILANAKAGSLIIDMSSIAPKVSEEIGACCAKQEVGFLDAPVSGGEIGAINGQLAIMVGGSEADFERAKPLFDVLGKSAVLCGNVGAGNVTKLANQIIVAANIRVLAEALLLAKVSGVNPETIFHAIKDGLAGSAVMNVKAPMMINGNFAPGFRIELHLKDINNAMETAKALGLPLEVTSQLQQVLLSLNNNGKGKLDHSGIARHVEQLAGKKISD